MVTVKVFYSLTKMITTECRDIQKVNKTISIMLLTVALLAPINIVGQTQSQDNIPLHHFQMSCDSCHESGFAADIVRSREKGNSFIQLKDNINQLCATSGCHDFDPALNHPVGVFSNNNQADMPLDSHSRITCLTCHNKPQTSPDNSYIDSGQERLLQIPQSRQFCSTCHVQMDNNLIEQSHWQFSTRAHLGGSMKQQSPTYNSNIQTVGGIDAESRTCLGCHDNISVSIPADNETPQQKRIRWKSMKDHPIGMSYDIKATQQLNRYQYPLLDERVRLFDGRVGCGSCHSLYAQSKNNLIAANEGTILCRKCHNR